MKPFFALIIFLFFHFSQAQTQYTLDSTLIEITEVGNNLEVPWEIIWGSDQSIWYTAQGKIISLNPQTGTQRTLATLSDMVSGGLTDKRMMGLTVSHNLQKPYVFVSYTYSDVSYTSLNWYKYLKVVRFDYDQTTISLSNPTTLLDGIKVYDGWHIAGKLIAGSDDKLYMTIGDAKQFENPENHPEWDGVLNNALDLDEYSGKVLRLNFDGSVPQDNPFAKEPYNQTPRNLIWTYGHRNTQGLVFGQNGKLYYAEHGPLNDDEVGIIKKGATYGWPIVEGVCNLPEEEDYCIQNANHVKPLKWWTPTIAPSNMEYYNDDQIPEWKNCLLIGTLTAGGRGNDIRVLQLSDDGQEIVKETILFDGEYLRIRDLCVSPVGDVYFSTSNRILGSGSLGNDDKIFKISRHVIIPELSVKEFNNKTLIVSNPFANELRLKTKGAQEVNVYSTDGKLISKTQSQSTIDSSQWPSGLYLVYVRFEAGEVTMQKALKR